jgi:hypothetical protein
MPTTIKLKNSVTTTSVPSSLVQGEVAINITDKKVWVGNAATTPIQLLGGGADGNFTNISVSSVATFGAGTVSAPSITTSGDTNTGIFFPAADTIAFTEGGTESMRITSSGDVCIGTTTANAKLEVVGGQFRVANTSTAALCIISTDSTSTNGITIESSYYGGAGYGPMKFNAGGSERMRINSSGNLLVGTTAETPGYGNTNTGQQLGGSSASTFSRGATDWVIVCNQNTVDGSTYYQMQFRVSDVSKGSITSTSSATAYNTSSDYRLKENIAPMTGALSTIKALKPVTYNWKVDGANGQGFIAHELQAVVPECVTGEKDAINADGTIKPQQMDTSFLVATLTAAIQEQQALIENLTTRLNALEGK